MNLRLLGIFLFLLSVTCAFAAVEVRSKQITMADGLANSTVRHFMQDSKGFIWMGTFNGLNRYDGNSFISYSPSLDNSLSLADRKVYNIQEDKNGFLWIYLSTERHSCYDLKSASFVDFTGCGEHAEKYASRMFASNGNIWLWHENNGARRVIYENGTFRSYTYRLQQGNVPSNTINFISEGENGVIWIGTNKGLVQVVDGNNTLVNNNENFHRMTSYHGSTYFCTRDGKIFIFDKSSSRLVLQTKLNAPNLNIIDHFFLENEWIICATTGMYSYDFIKKEVKSRYELFGEQIHSANVIKDNKDNYWIYNHSGKMWYLNVQTGEKKVFRLIPNEKLGHIDAERYSVVHDSRNIIWISTYGNGLFAYDITKDELTHFTAGMSGFSHISSDYLLGVMEDRSGEIWVSVEFEGVSRITVINEGSYRYFPENPNLLDRSNTIRMISRVNEDEIWIGTRRGGLYVYDMQFNLKYSRKDFHSNIYAVLKDDKGKIWMGTRGDGLCIDNTWYKHTSDPESLGNDNIFCLFKDSKQRMWVGTFGGGLDVPIKKDNKYIFRHFFNENYNQRQIRTICEDKNGWLWLGTSNGIYVFHPDSLLADPKAYYHYNYAQGQLRSNEIKYIFSDSRGDIWIAASGFGVSLCTPNGDYSSLEFNHYGIDDGLCNDVVQSIAEDRQGNIWMGTEYGISKFVHSEQLFESYFFSAYSHGNVYTEGSVSQCDNGDLILGSNYGFIVFSPEMVKKSSVVFPVVFTNLNVNGINMLPGDPDSPLTSSLAYSEGITLKHNQNSITIDFSSFNYSDTRQTKYSYMLENYDKTWSAPSTLSFAAYKMLPPGKYELLVKSCNSSGVWSDTVSSLLITVNPPIYLTPWAFVLYALFIIIALYFTYRVTRNFYLLNNKIAVEKQLTEYKLVFFTNISHEFRTPLTLIQGALERIRRMGDIPKEVTYPLQTMEKSTRRMLRLIDQLLEFRKMQNNKLALSLEKTDVVAMLYEIFLSFEDMAESKNMDFQFIPSVTSYKMYIDKGKLDKITYNMLSNAFKYTPQGGRVCLYVNIHEEKQLLEIQVTDTGVGIPREKRSELFNRFMQSSFSGESVGVGLHLTHELVTVHKGEIKYDDNPGGGSVFTVVLPLDEHSYEEKDFLVPTNLLTQEKKEPILLDMLDNALEQFVKPNPLNKQKILVIEDDIDVRQYLREELSAYFQVEVADNGTTGFQMAQEVEPDLIVCDVLMPGMNGYEVTRKLKSEFNTSHIPVILLTALTLPENHLEGIESGADAYLSKPFSIRLLLTRIVKLLEQREKLKEKFSEEPGIVRSAVYASERDKEFVDQLHQILVDNLGNSHFSVDEFASLMNIGRTVFYKKVKGITGYSPNEYLRIMRMKKAAELLLAGNLTVSEVSYKVGIDDPFYFSKCFKAQFGIAPSVYQKGK
ncbi:hybrid sensor histidine kinase/response regulator transcription factor [Bacteroides sp. 51]|uniref:hybrid sensor histidine kinase/response regulator transcription factor n=1 Tax=Bacteroides sp. 51 TaxID=2302938 RepID=UPI0013D67B8E|nr:hybrid sensor histidine kinase/response regulator transcription factor [Bacteroides sp. 51]NDV82171.1 hybrid sensor histidine kinase/response regulator [Bacteroides sp. 51]